MDDSLKHAGALIGKRPADHYQRLCYGGYSPGSRLFWTALLEYPSPSLPAGRPNPSYRALPAAKTVAVLFYGDSTESERQTAQSLPSVPAQPWIQNSGNAVFPKSCTDQGSNIMKLLIFNASPKKRGSASQFFSGILRVFFPALSKKRFLCGRGKTLTMHFPSWAARTPYVSLSALCGWIALSFSRVPIAGRRIL